MGLLAIVPVFDKLIDKLIPDPAEKAKLSLELAQIADQEAAREAANELQQIELNKVEASHKSLFVAGWRPAIGWVGAASLAMYYPVQIGVQLVLTGKVDMDLGDLFMLIAGLLGFGGMRSFDKTKGTADDTPLGKVNVPVANPILKPKSKSILPDWLR
jgi:hypothetical protein